MRSSSILINDKRLYGLKCIFVARGISCRPLLHVKSKTVLCMKFGNCALSFLTPGTLDGSSLSRYFRPRNFLRVVFQLPPIALRRVSKYNTPSVIGVES